MNIDGFNIEAIILRDSFLQVSGLIFSIGSCRFQLALANLDIQINPKQIELGKIFCDPSPFKQLFTPSPTQPHALNYISGKYFGMEGQDSRGNSLLWDLGILEFQGLDT